MSNPQAIQESEVEALQAIFGEDFTQVKVKTAWKNVPAPVEFCIRIHPEEEDLKSQVGLTLRARLPAKYPKTAPTISLEDAKGINPSEVDALQAKLQKQAGSLLGSEMIFELASLSSTYLTERHSIVRSVQHSSLIHERTVRATYADEQHRRDAELEARNLEQLRLSEDQALARQVEEHIEKKAELARKGRERLAPTQAADAEARESTPLPTSFSMSADSRSLLVTRGHALSPVEIGEVFTATVGARNNARLHVIEIRGRYYESAQGKAKLARIMEDLGSLRRLRHPSLHHVQAAQFSEHRLAILTEPAPSAPLRDLLDQSGNLRVDRAMRYLTQVLDALSALHGAHLIHRAVKSSNVFLQSEIGSGGFGGEPLAKLANASWLQRLVDVNNSNPFTEHSKDAPVPDGWLCPGTVEDPFSYDRRRDLHDLGVLFAQMLFGFDVIYTFSSPAALLASLPTSFSEQATMMLSEMLSGTGESSAASLRQKLMSALQSDLAPTSSNRTEIPRSPALPRTAVMPTPMDDGQRGLFWQPQSASAPSRYRADFEEVEFLGKGGFGRVVKARNRLDGRFYAIKKIVMPPDPGAEEKIRREVTILSRMNHVYIVRYHACWFEVEDAAAVREASPAVAPTIRAAALAESSPSSSSNSDSDADTIEDEDEDDRTVFDMDIRPPDLDDFLASDRHRNLDVSYPSIRFGTASATGSNTTSRSLTPAPSDDTGGESMASPQPRRTFFMQMEYVDSQTLREAIDRGFDDDAEPWHIARQILQAIVHYVSLHIIHRDLKPSNIFLDAKGDVRVGDFGLAVNQPGQDADPSSGQQQQHSDLTSDVGTSLYVAPEILSRAAKGGARYSEKIDIFSFGILAFEMWMPLRTGHERVEVLRQLRRPEIWLPAAWPFPADAPQTRLVKWCLSHEPDKRPSALELLKSDIFPPQPEEENISEVIRLLIQPDHPFSHHFFPMLLQRPSHDLMRRDFAYDFHQADSSRAALDDPYNPIISAHLAQKFRQRGAIPFDSPMLIPKLDDPRKFVQLLDTEGNVVGLHYDTVGPFARMVARDSSLARLKRFSLQPVFRDNPAGGQPVVVPAASFDIVSSSVTLAAEAEVIQLADESLNMLPLSSDFEHIINHGALWNTVFRSIPEKHRGAVRNMLEHFSRDPSASWRDLVSSTSKKIGLPKAVFEEIRMIFDVCDDVANVQRHFEDSTAILTPPMSDALQDLRHVVQLAERVGCQAAMKAWPILAPPPQSSCAGIFFETRLKNKRHDVLVVGGRYDALVQKLSPPGLRASHAKSLVSASFAVAKLSRSIGRRLRDISDSPGAEEWQPRRCDVYVVSYTDGLVEERLDVMKELWAAGISADLMYDEDWKVASTSADSILQTCRAEGVLFMVIVKAKSTQAVRVKNVINRTETEVYLHELGTWLDEALLEHRKAHGGSTSRPSLAKQRSKLAEGLSSARDLQIILPGDATRKTKHKARNMVLDRAPALVMENAKAVTNLPIYAVELDEPAFTRLTTDNTWLTSADTYRSRVVDAVPTSRKAYAWQIRDAVLAYTQRAPNERWLWMFSLRTGACQLLPLTVV